MGRKKNKGKKSGKKQVAAGNNTPQQSDEQKVEVDVPPHCQGASASASELKGPSPYDTSNKQDQIASGELVEDNGSHSVIGVDQHKPKADVPPERKGVSSSGDKIKSSSPCDTDIGQQKPPSGIPLSEAVLEDVDEQENGDKFYPCNGSSEGDFVVVKGMSPQLLGESRSALSTLSELLSVCTELYGLPSNKGTEVENTRMLSTANSGVGLDQTEKLALREEKRLLQEEKEALEKKMEDKERQLQQTEIEKNVLERKLEEKEEERANFIEENRKEKEAMTSKCQQLEKKLRKIEQEKQEMKNQHQKENEKTLDHFHTEMATRKRKIDEYEQKERQLVYENKNLQQEKVDWEKERHEASECIKRLREENDSLSTSLSKMMNDKMNEDESQVENVCIKARPLKLVEDFEMFCTDEWLAAKTELDECTDVVFLMTNEQKQKLLLDILMEASIVTAKHLQDHMKLIKQLLDDPVHNKERTPAVEELNGTSEDVTVLTDYATPTNKMPSELEIEITKYLKICSGHIDCMDMAKPVLEKMLRTISDDQISPQTKSSENLLKYSASACLLTWKMALQRPPMYFEANKDIGESFNQDKHDLHFGTTDPRTPGVRIMSYVFPGLWHSGKLMKKGRVILGK